MVSDDDRKAFREAMRGVRRLRIGVPEPVQSHPGMRPRARFAHADRLAALADSLADLRQPSAPVIENGEELLYRGPGISEQIFRRLRRADFRLGDSICTPHASMHVRLIAFLPPV